MNFYNPYYMPYNVASKGLFSNLFGKISFSSILSGTQKTLNIVNQAIPIVKQVSPMIKNARTMFKVVNEFGKQDKPINTVQEKNYKQETYQNGPTFFE